MKRITVFGFIALFIALISIAGCKKDEDDNPCDSITCQNGGNCVNGQCSCPQRWAGEFCQTPTGTNPCFGITCQNGGTCVNGQCNCPSGWTGQYCQTPVGSDPCVGIACQNGGTCTNGQCNCLPGWSGSLCQTAVNPSLIRVTKVSITRFPATDNGAGWDFTSGPDIFPIVLNGINAVVWDSPTYKENAITGVTYDFYPTPFDLFPGIQYQIDAYDFDDLDPNDWMGGVVFTLTTSGLPSSVTLDAGGSVAFRINVSYIY